MVNIFFVGDELVAGYGDARALGWTGRVLARTSNEPPLMPLTLAIPGENTDSLAKRWAEEVGRRIHPEEDNRLVLGLGCTWPTRSTPPCGCGCAASSSGLRPGATSPARSRRT